tara:strand:- start:307 stop:489 length:183 start_codon:yes stop_codon:yes gene_type:complete
MAKLLSLIENGFITETDVKLAATNYDLDPILNAFDEAGQFIEITTLESELLNHFETVRNS